MKCWALFINLWMLECVLCLCSCARLCVQIFDSFLICNMSGNWQRIVAISRNFIRFPFFMLLFNLRMYAQLLKILFDNSLPYHYLSSASNLERKTIRFLFKTTLFLRKWKNTEYHSQFSTILHQNALSNWQCQYGRSKKSFIIFHAIVIIIHYSSFVSISFYFTC